MVDIINSLYELGTRDNLESFLLENYSHGVFGCFEYGHFFQEAKGPHKETVESLSDSEVQYTRIFNGDENKPQFLARVITKYFPRSQGRAFKLMYNDRQLDIREGSHTDYTLFIPDSDSYDFSNLVKNNPSLLIDSFQIIFPTYDRSNGKLKLDENFKLQFE